MRGSPLRRRTVIGSSVRTFAFGARSDDRGLDDGLLAERGEHLGDVAQEGPARSEHQHPLTGELRMVVEQERSAVEADSRLPRARARPAR